MSSTEVEAADLLPGAPLSRAAQLTRRVLWLYTAIAATILVLISLSALPAKGGFEKLRSMGVGAATSGLGVVALSIVLLTLAAFLATTLLTESRIWSRRTETADPDLPATPATIADRFWRFGPGVLARQGQAVVLTLAAVVIFLLARFLWPHAKGPLPDGSNANLSAALVIGLAFPSLIAERAMNAFPAAQLPEAPGLRRLLLISTILMAATGAITIGQGAGLVWLVWLQCALLAAICLVAAELALRALARLFLPPPSVETAKGAVDSILAALVTGGARAPGALIRTHLGLDFARSWALTYLRAAIIPAVVCTLLLCWFLTGLKLLGDDQRGIYERLGAPVRILGPGIHVLMPWPLGRLRPVEYGTIHTLAVGVDALPDSSDQVSAEGTPTAAMNRLWDTRHATEAHNLVASQSENPQDFQAVASEILVLYRTGLSEAAAWQSVYGASSQQEIVKEEADRLVTRYFSSHTLDEVMGAQRQSLEGELRAELAQAVAADHAGIDIVAVLIEEIHPPAGAAEAYHAVQAAQIDAEAKVANATAHAERTKGEAQQEAQQALDSAQAAAVEKIQRATADAYQFDADRRAYRLAPESMLLERRAKNLIPALKGARVTIIDSGLNGAQGPLIDLRNGTGGSIAAVAAAGPGVNPAPPQSPATSTEQPPPPLTTEEADADARPGRHE